MVAAQGNPTQEGVRSAQGQAEDFPGHRAVSFEPTSIGSMCQAVLIRQTADQCMRRKRKAQASRCLSYDLWWWCRCLPTVINEEHALFSDSPPHFHRLALTVSRISWFQKFNSHVKGPFRHIDGLSERPRVVEWSSCVVRTMNLDTSTLSHSVLWRGVHRMFVQLLSCLLPFFLSCNFFRKKKKNATRSPHTARLAPILASCEASSFQLLVRCI